MKESSDRLKQLHDSIAPLMRQGRLREACDLIALERDRASASNRRAEAAALSIMLGSFLSISGCHEEGLAAHVFAEEVEPENPHHVLATARFLLSSMNDLEAAKARASHVLSCAISPNHKLLHDAHSILGLCAAKSQNYESALSHLRKAQDVASAYNIPAIFWDFSLAREVAATPEGQIYLMELIQRAQSEGDEVTEERGMTILREA